MFINYYINKKICNIRKIRPRKWKYNKMCCNIFIQYAIDNCVELLKNKEFQWTKKNLLKKSTR